MGVKCCHWGVWATWPPVDMITRHLKLFTMLKPVVVKRSSWLVLRDTRSTRPSQSSGVKNFSVCFSQTHLYLSQNNTCMWCENNAGSFSVTDSSLSLSDRRAGDERWICPLVTLRTNSTSLLSLSFTFFCFLFFCLASQHHLVLPVECSWMWRSSWSDLRFSSVQEFQSRHQSVW